MRSLDTVAKTKLIGENMKYTKTKNTKRFAFIVDRNTTAKQAGSNTVTIATQASDDGQYSVGQSSLTLTVREARALNSFLNDSLDSVSVG
jgi:hypothetical protein